MLKNHLISSVIFTLILLSSFCCCFEPTQTVTITKEDIVNAKPTPNEVSFSSKELKAVEMMERRHFLKTYPEFSDFERLKNLEYELLGKTWLYTPTENRIKTLKIASSNTMLKGTALPASISSIRNAKRMQSSIPLREKDEVGLIDGFLRLISPEKYRQFRMYSDRMLEYD